jgi:hypothetical protein
LKNTESEPDCPCFDSHPSYTLCKKCVYIKTCVMPCLDKTQVVEKTIAPIPDETIQESAMQVAPVQIPPVVSDDKQFDDFPIMSLRDANRRFNQR